MVMCRNKGKIERKRKRERERRRRNLEKEVRQRKGIQFTISMSFYKSHLCYICT